MSLTSQCMCHRATLYASSAPKAAACCSIPADGRKENILMLLKSTIIFFRGMVFIAIEIPGRLNPSNSWWQAESVACLLFKYRVCRDLCSLRNGAPSYPLFSHRHWWNEQARWRHHGESVSQTAGTQRAEIGSVSILLHRHTVVLLEFSAWSTLHVLLSAGKHRSEDKRRFPTQWRLLHLLFEAVEESHQSSSSSPAHVPAGSATFVWPQSFQPNKWIWPSVFTLIVSPAPRKLLYCLCIQYFNDMEIH